ncbi:Bud-site selection protein [Polychaeton citri CBS 116435]|uniref:Bud-site selection protein n=1 Tax=Polychaeton citri CBS 116435 TaxID=1314669 RepID=A0A9P4Q487_9PEZI|nr:Bud-site selection protein [Polychaeton citri CBS 116435]
MPKRKRDDSLADGSAPLSARQQRAQHHLDQGVRKLAHAIKVAKGFERQKLGRRQKTAAAEKNVKDSERIETEIAALKTLDAALSAQQYLYKTLIKIKAIAESKDLPPSVLVPPRKRDDAASLNVNARLLNSNPVRNALSPVLQEMQRVLGIEIPDSAGPKKRLRKKDFEEAAQKSSHEGGDAVDTYSEEEVRELGLGGSDTEDDFAGFDDRLASSEDGSSVGGSDIDIADLERQLELEGISLGGSTKTKSQTYDHTADLSLSEEESYVPSSSPEPQKSAKAVKAPTKSNFLPSLSLGGYISGGSDSEIEDIDAIAPKKNRRGQRERQKIWEKKYGTKAKHLDGQKKEDRNAGWDSKRGATSGGDRKGKWNDKRKAGGRGARGEQSATGANDAPVKERKATKDDEGPLHPSWQAKKLAKERASAPAKFEGKKITFD